MSSKSQISSPITHSSANRPSWTPALTTAWWLVGATPVAFFLGAMLSIGDPGTSLAFAALAAIPAAICSVTAFVRTVRWYALLPAFLVGAAALVMGAALWQEAHPGNGGIDPQVVAVTVSFQEGESPECVIPGDLVVAAGDHALIVEAEGGTTVTVAGPAPASTVVGSYTRPDDSDGFGPSLPLEAGTYTITCTRGTASATTELTVVP